MKSDLWISSNSGGEDMAETKVEETPRKILLNAVQVTSCSFTHIMLCYTYFHTKYMYCSTVIQGEKFKSNKISTAKYNLITFIPRFLFEQFRR